MRGETTLTPVLILEAVLLFFLSLRHIYVHHIIFKHNNLTNVEQSGGFIFIAFPPKSKYAIKIHMRDQQAQIWRIKPVI